MVIVMMIRGANKLPQMGAGLAKRIWNFKKSTDEKEEIDTTPKKIEETQKSRVTRFHRVFCIRLKTIFFYFFAHGTMVTKILFILRRCTNFCEYGFLSFSKELTQKILRFLPKNT